MYWGLLATFLDQSQCQIIALIALDYIIIYECNEQNRIKYGCNENPTIEAYEKLPDQNNQHYNNDKRKLIGAINNFLIDKISNLLKKY